MWNDTDTPLACLITFRCYGTWLHGDERGSTDRVRNIYKSLHIEPSKRWERHNQRSLTLDPVTLNPHQRTSIEQAISDTCTIRGWYLHALNVRTNHVHVVVSTRGRKGSVVLNALKANATRQMRQDGNWTHPHSPWSDKGSSRYLWNERAVAAAIDYVLNGQGKELPNLD